MITENVERKDVSLQFTNKIGKIRGQKPQECWSVFFNLEKLFIEISFTQTICSIHSFTTESHSSDGQASIKLRKPQKEQFQ